MDKLKKFPVITLFIILTINYCSNSVESANILGVFTSQSKSHLVIHFAVVRALVERGHNVTVVTTLPYKEPNLTGFRHLVIEPTISYENEVKKLITANTTINKIKYTFNAIKTLADISSNVTQADSFQKLMKEDQFDLILLGYIFNEFHLGLGAHFNCPTILIWVQKPFYVIDRLVGNPLFALDYSRLSQMALDDSFGSGFLYRLTNFLLAAIEFSYTRAYDYAQKIYYEALFPPDKYPSYETQVKNISLLLVNHHFSEKFIRANVPAFIEIGGIQSKSQPDPLPNDIKKFLDDSSEHGAIFFSLGTNVKVEHLKAGTITNIYTVLSSLKQNVIWKWDNNKTPGQAKNILFKNWLPQDDILAHRNTKLFITHGGKGSLVEAAFHGVPMIGIPIFADQSGNVNEMVVGKSFGVAVDIESLTVESFKNAINEVLTNDTYTKHVKHYSQVYRDRPMTAKETALYWIEYVIRHRGAKHMQSATVSMNSYQLLCLDIMAFLLVIFYVAYRITKFCFKAVWRKCCSRRLKKLETKDRKKSKNE